MASEEHSVEPKQPLIKCTLAGFNLQLVAGDGYNYSPRKDPFLATLATLKTTHSTEYCKTLGNLF